MASLFFAIDFTVGSYKVFLVVMPFWWTGRRCAFAFSSLPRFPGFARLSASPNRSDSMSLKTNEDGTHALLRKRSNCATRTFAPDKRVRDVH
jgi:hypothetical protein